MLDIPCVIFAGGKSSRMGEDKSLLPFAGFDTLTQFQLSRLQKIFKTVYISCKDKSKFNFLTDNEESFFIEDIGSKSLFAPTAGFVSIYNTIKDDSFFALSVDSPFVGEDEISQIIAADKSENDATIARTKLGMQPMCGVYHRSLESGFNKMLQEENHKLGLLLKASKTVFVEFENEASFLNMNHPHEYQEALKLV